MQLIIIIIIFFEYVVFFIHMKNRAAFKYIFFSKEGASVINANV